MHNVHYHNSDVTVWVEPLLRVFWNDSWPGVSKCKPGSLYLSFLFCISLSSVVCFFDLLHWKEGGTNLLSDTSHLVSCTEVARILSSSLVYRCQRDPTHSRWESISFFRQHHQPFVHLTRLPGPPPSPCERLFRLFPSFFPFTCRRHRVG